MRAQLNPSTCQLGQKTCFMPRTGFLWKLELQRCWNCSWEKQEVTATIACSYHWLSLGHPCVRCCPSYSCFLGHRNSVLVPTDWSREVARDQAGKGSDIICSRKGRQYHHYTQRGRLLSLSSVCFPRLCAFHSSLSQGGGAQWFWGNSVPPRRMLFLGFIVGDSLDTERWGISFTSILRID